MSDSARSTSRGRCDRMGGYTVYEGIWRRWATEKSKKYRSLCTYRTHTTSYLIYACRCFYQPRLYRRRAIISVYSLRLIIKNNTYQYMSQVFLILLLIISSTLPLYAWEGFIVESIGTGRNIESRKKLIESVLSSDQMFFGYSALSIILDTKLIEPRWQMQGKSIRLSPSVVKESEFVQLLVHEIAHYIDIYNLIGFGSTRDPSDEFYAISWEGKKTKRSTETTASFISWYAATNAWEDFAESFTFYVFHNDEFAERALKNESLRQKYLFFWNSVFTDWAFLGTDFSIGTVPSYLWDTTKVPISVKKYLYFLR